MKDAELRKQIADCLRYLKNGREYGYYIQREDVEVLEDTIDTTHSGASIDMIVEGISPEDYDKVFIRGVYTRDYEGYDSAQIDVYSIRKQTDKEYFDSICDYLLPFEHKNQYFQYESYLKLKKQFESE